MKLPDPNILEQLPAVIYRADVLLDRQIVEVYGIAEDILGRSPDDVINSCNGFIHSDDQPRVNQLFQNLPTDKYEIQYRVLVNGKPRWVTDIGRVTNKHSSEVIGIIISSPDSFETQRYLEHLRDIQSQQLDIAEAQLETQISVQVIQSEQQIEKLQKAQYRQAIVFEVASCDSIVLGNVKQAISVICNKLKSGLEVDFVAYFEHSHSQIFNVKGYCGAVDLANVEQTFAFSRRLINEINAQLCLDIQSVKSGYCDIQAKLNQLFPSQSQLVMPIKNGGQLLGFTFLASISTREWSFEEIVFAFTLSEQIKVAHINDERAQYARKLHHLAHFDPLTGLHNRTSFYESISNSYQQYQEQQHALIYLDLDEFKAINDNFGHHTGDQVLIHVANLLRSVTRGTDQLARVGGDEFNIFLVDVKSRDNTLTIVENFLALMKQPIEITGAKSHLSLKASLGITMLPDDVKDLQQAIMCADQAMYHAKTTQNLFFSFYQDIN